MRLVLLIFFATCATYGLAATTKAQVTVIDGVEAFSLLTSPELPKAHQPFTVTATGTLAPLSDAKIQFFVNGVLNTESEGRPFITLTAPESGKSMIVRAVVETAEETYQNQIIVSPQDAVLILEPLSTIPETYKGAALLPARTEARIVAIPDFRTANGNSIPASELVYSWQVGERLLEDFSGIGRSTLRIEGPSRYRTETVSVYVTTQDKRFVARADVEMTPVPPVVRLYRTTPLVGTVFSTAIGASFVMSSDEDTFTAFPFFFRDWPALSWRVGGVSGGSDRALTVRSGGSGEGSANVQVEASDAETLSVARASTQVSFGNSASRPTFPGL